MSGSTQMKASEAMLKGWNQVKKQCFGSISRGDPQNPSAVCALGAHRLGMYGNTRSPFFESDFEEWCLVMKAFRASTGMSITEANDTCGWEIPKIAAKLAELGY